MEVLSEMILLLQVLASIQLMLVHRQMLQQINKQSAKVDVILENMQELMEGKEKSMPESNPSMRERETLEQLAEESANVVREKEVQEALINEVLSEVFS